MLPVCNRKYFPRSSPNKANFCLLFLQRGRYSSASFARFLAIYSGKCDFRHLNCRVIKGQLWCQRCMWQPLSFQSHQQWVWSQSPFHASESLLHMRTSVTASNSSNMSGSSFLSSMILILQDVQSYKRRTSTRALSQ